MQVVLGIIFAAGLLIAIGSQICLLILIFRGSAMLFLLALLVPFFTWYFAIQNWDIPKRPFLFHIGGLATWLIAGFLLSAIAV